MKMSLLLVQVRTVAVVLTVLLSVLSVECEQAFGCTLSPDLDNATLVPIIERPARFSTPNYPGLAPPGLNCRWRATSDEGPLTLNCQYTLPESDTCTSTTPNRIEVFTKWDTLDYCGNGVLSIVPANQLERLIAVTLSILLSIISVQCDQSYVCSSTTRTEPQPFGYTIQGDLKQFETPDYPNCTLPGLSCWWRSDNVEPLNLSCSYSLSGFINTGICNETVADYIAVTTADGNVAYYCNEGTFTADQATRLEYRTSQENQGGKMFCNVIKSQLLVRRMRAITQPYSTYYG